MLPTIINAKITKINKNNNFILVALCLSVFIVQADTSIVNIATYPIGIFFNASLAKLQWVVDAYNLIYAVSLLSAGALADIYGRKRLFILGIIIFLLSSVGCAISGSINFLIFFRGLSGIGAAFLIASSMAIIRVTWTSPVKRGFVLSLWAGCNGVALAVAPTVGGLLIKIWQWPSIFLFAIPFCIISLIISASLLQESSDINKQRTIDIKAQLYSLVFLGALVFGVIQLHKSIITFIVSIIISVLFMLLFILQEKKIGYNALVPLSFFTNISFVSTLVISVSMTFGMYGILFLLPIFWQQTDFFTSTQAGLALLPMALFFITVSPFSVIFEKRVGTTNAMCCGVFMIALGIFLNAFFTLDLLFLEIGLALTGIGMGLAAGSAMNLAVSSVPAERAGTSSSVVNVARMVGATLGVAVLGSINNLFSDKAVGLTVSLFTAGVIQIFCVAITCIFLKHKISDIQLIEKNTKI